MKNANLNLFLPIITIINNDDDDDDNRRRRRRNDLKKKNSRKLKITYNRFERERGGMGRGGKGE